MLADRPALQARIGAPAVHMLGVAVLQILRLVRSTTALTVTSDHEISARGCCEFAVGPLGRAPSSLDLDILATAGQK
jgi:hypothetical protein